MREGGVFAGHYGNIHRQLSVFTTSVGLAHTHPKDMKRGVCVRVCVCVCVCVCMCVCVCVCVCV